MTRRNNYFRKIMNVFRRLRLRKRNVSVIASNCIGGCICHDLGLAFRSPFVNLFLTAEDFLKFLEAPKEYLAEPLEFVPDSGTYYPVARLKDVMLHFVHYESKEQAQSAWERRKQRIDWDNLYVIMTDRDGCNDELLRRFDALPYKNKAVFTHLPRPDIRSAVYIPGFEDEDQVGVCTEFISPRSGKRHYDKFNYVKWLNEGK